MGRELAPRFSAIFAPELHHRLLWFANLRWFAVCGLCLGALFGSRLGFDRAWPGLFWVALFVAAYNLVISIALRRRKPRQVAEAAPYSQLRLGAIRDMVVDLTALVFTMHFTGGMSSPVLPFVAFHMAIGTILVRQWVMWIIAAGTCVGAALLLAIDSAGPSAESVVAGGAYSSVLDLLALVVLVFGIVYLTGSVTTGFRRRSIERYVALEKLREKTAELERSLAEREEMEKQKAHYMRISTHQLRSPLGTIKTSLQVLLDGYLDPGSDGGRHLLVGLADRVDDLLAIVNDLLELTKMREGKEKAPWTREVFINQVLADIFDALEPVAEDRNVKLVADIEGIARLEWGVPPDLVYAFENLIQNAIKYSHEGGEVKVTMRVEERVATVVVADQGIGVPEEYQKEVFLEFVRAPNAKRQHGEGTGLGLTIVREAIRAHGGEVTLVSSEGGGSQFTASLPLDFEPTELHFPGL